MLGAFAAVEVSSRRPMLDPQLLGQPQFLASISGALFTGLAVVGLMSYAPALMQQSLHISEIGSAAVLAAWSATSMVVALAAGSLPSRLPAQTRLLIGLALAAAGEVALTGLGTGTGWTRLVPGLFITGLGTGVVNAALGRIAVESVPHGRVGMGSGANNTARYLGGAAGAALIVSIASAGGAHRAHRRLEHRGARIRRVVRARGGDRRELPHVATPQRSSRPHRSRSRTPARCPTPWTPPTPASSDFHTRVETTPNHQPPLTHPEDRMTTQLNYLVAQHRHIELVYRAEQARLAAEARAAGSAPSPRWNLGRLLAPRRLRAARLAAAAQPRNTRTAA